MRVITAEEVDRALPYPALIEALRDAFRADIETPLRVQVANSDSNPHSVKVTGSIRTQPLRQEWDYDTVVIVPDTNPMQALKPLGLAGWETTGVSWTNAQGAMTLLLKRPR